MGRKKLCWLLLAASLGALLDHISGEPYWAGFVEDVDHVSPDRGWSGCWVRPGTSFLTPHFVDFSLQPSCALEVSNPSGSEVYMYTHNGRSNLTKFWGYEIHGDRICFQYTCANSADYDVSFFVLDQLGIGNPVDRHRRVHESDQRQPTRDRQFPHTRQLIICDEPDFVSALSLASSSDPDEREMYQAAQAVVRLAIDGIGTCTGFLIGPKEIMTNLHCFRVNSVFQESILVQGTTVYFMEETSDGSTSISFSIDRHLGNSDDLAERGDWVVFTVLPQADGALPGDLFTPITINSDTAVYVDQRVSASKKKWNPWTDWTFSYWILFLKIFIPQHPAGRPKEIAFLDDAESSSFCDINGVYHSIQEIRYSCDTEGGSSGSPVLDFSDKRRLLAIHTGGGGCSNGGMPVQYFASQVLSLLETSTPTNLPTPRPTPQPTPNPTPQPTPNPTPNPSPQPTPNPTPRPTPNPTPQPTPNPTPNPSPQPTPIPTPQPTPNPTPQPSPIPTPLPTPTPTAGITNSPIEDTPPSSTQGPVSTTTPTEMPTVGSEELATADPTNVLPLPTSAPSAGGTGQPTPGAQINFAIGPSTPTTSGISKISAFSGAGYSLQLLLVMVWTLR